MSQTILEKLLKGAEVEWKPIDEIFTLRNGYTPSKSVKEYWIGGTVPWFRMEDLRAGERILTDSAQKVHINGVKGKLFPKDSIIMSTSATVGEHALILTDFLCNQRFTNFSVREKYKAFLDIKYVYYYFFVIDKKAQENTSISSFPSVQMDKLKKWMFPIPPVSVQQEIVRILDAFTAHTAELTAELNERKKQYNYYRDKLLTFSDDEVEWKPLGEVCEFKNGFAFKSRLFKEEGNPIVRITNIDGNFVNTDDVKYFQMKDYKEDLTSYTVNKGDIIIAMSGATTGKIGLYNYEYTSYLNQRVGKFIPKQKILNNKYLYHFLLLKINDIFLFAGGGAQPNLSSKKLMEKFKIPIPPLSVQKEIVRILDSFWTLTTSISEGLPREIELRNKQYEYYRDQLLNFPKLENDAIKHNSTNR
ncbi:restriction endonuclease subunit S [Bartonella sp. B10834G6]|uniref:restriction endonuclease subunit S n=1 Tax=Bartonella apis TaxID=1686310 RepID=UPI0018DBE3B8|nr:restriction endonuclease subunit S [Bartonella apis]MBH9981382.1 restriction endonuclease subunit S [Bartonella apis]